MKYYIAQPPQTKPITTDMLESYVHIATFILGLISIVTMLWKIASFMQVLSISIDLLKKDVQALENVIKRIHKRYENVQMFLIKQHGVDYVSKSLKIEESEDE